MSTDYTKQAILTKFLAPTKTHPYARIKAWCDAGEIFVDHAQFSHDDAFSSLVDALDWPSHNWESAKLPKGINAQYCFVWVGEGGGK